MSGKTNRKHGRNKKDCERYKLAGRQEYNALVKQARHLKRQPGDKIQSTAAANYTRKSPLDAFEKLFSKKT